MSKKVLFIAGHGQGSRYDVGAVGVYGRTEADEVRKFVNAVNTVSNGEINIYTARDVFQDGNFNVVASGYDEVVEIHFNAFNKHARGSEVLIHSDYTPDEIDLKLVKALGKYFTLRQGGIKYRSDLRNMNMAREKGVSYRLVEICFIDSDGDMSIYDIHFNNIVKDFVAVFTGEQKKGWVKFGNQWKYHDGKTGYVKDQWLQEKDDYYYLGKDEYMSTGWIKWKGQYYYLDDKAGGRMVANDIRRIDGKLYAFDKTGAMLTSVITIDNNGEIKLP